MVEQQEYELCSAEILSEYRQIKEVLSTSNIAICQHIGTFSQDILISIVSLVERTLIQKGEPIRLQKRLNYLIIECIQNIIYHSDNLPDENQLAYIFVTKNKKGYTISSANSIENKNIEALESRINGFLDVKTDILAKIFSSKIQNPIIDKNGNGGIGLLTMVSKSGKGFRYEITKASKNYSIFHIELKIKYKNFN